MKNLTPEQAMKMYRNDAIGGKWANVKELFLGSTMLAPNVLWIAIGVVGEALLIVTFCPQLFQ